MAFYFLDRATNIRPPQYIAVFLDKITYFNAQISMKNIYIEILYEKLKNILSDNFIGVMIECCALRLTLQGHDSPLILSLLKIAEIC